MQVITGAGQLPSSSQAMATPLGSLTVELMYEATRQLGTQLPPRSLDHLVYKRIGETDSKRQPDTDASPMAAGEARQEELGAWGKWGELPNAPLPPQLGPPLVAALCALSKHPRSLAPDPWRNTAWKLVHCLTQLATQHAQQAHAVQGLNPPLNPHSLPGNPLPGHSLSAAVSATEGAQGAGPATPASPGVAARGGAGLGTTDTSQALSTWPPWPLNPAALAAGADITAGHTVPGLACLSTSELVGTLKALVRLECRQIGK